jgi:[pyruvate, water dikinase]-phosphate phosphotransferase / [pyruvate, water dikinase] kinase
MTAENSKRRTVFFVSDHSGVTAETLGHTLLSQFGALAFSLVTLPFVDTPQRAHEALLKIDAAAAADEVRPLVFSTLVRETERGIVKRTRGLFLDFFDAFLAPLEAELGQQSVRALGRVHGMSDVAAYMARIDATNFALAHDDGNRSREYEGADVVLIGVSRTGKTPTCLYLALHYGIYAANCPLTEDDLEHDQLPAAVRPHANKLFGLTVQPARLRQIREARRPESVYASSQQVQYELRAAEQLYQRFNVRHIDATHCSVEEISSRILQDTGIARRARP